MSVSAELVLARHGEAACNVAGRVGGPRTCTGLTTRGHDQADRLAERLSAEPAFDVLYTSPRRRTQETAARLAHQLRLEPHTDSELRGLDHGAADGADWTDLKSRFGGRPQFRPHMPLAPGAESWNAFLTRTGNALARLLTLHTGQRVLIAAHGETIEASFALLLNLPLSEDEYPGTVTGHTCLTRWQQHRNRLGHCVWMLTSHNDTHHLTTVTAEQAQT